MKTVLIATTTIALLAAPASAQLLNRGSVTGTLGSSLDVTSTVDRGAQSVRSTTRSAAEGSARTSGEQSVDRRSGRVKARRDAKASGDASLANMTELPMGAVDASGSGQGRASGEGSADTRLIGTDDVRAIRSRAAGTARGTAQTLVEPARAQAGTVPGSATGALRGMASGSGRARGSASGDPASGLFAASGSAAAMTEGAFAIAPGMPVYSPDGDRIGKVREVIASGRGEIREVVVQGRGGARRLVDAGQLSVAGSGRGLIMGETYAGPAPEPAEPSDD